MNKWTILFFLFISFQGLYAQNECTIDICNNNSCGNVFVTYRASGQNVFCEGGQVTLDNASSTLDFDFFIVDWGDGTIDTVPDYRQITHIYNFQGLDRCSEGPIYYQPFCYIGYKECPNGFSCNYATGIVSIELKPVAKFETEPEICISDPAIFTNNSCNATSYLWEFGDGTTSAEESPQHYYSTPGTYNVKLTVTNQCGSDSQIRQITVVGLPVADAEFTLNPSTGCIPVNVSFTNLSQNINQGSQFVTWEITPPMGWRYKDSTYNAHTWDNEIRFTQEGVYNISLTVENLCGEDVWEDSIELFRRPTVDILPFPPSCLDQGPASFPMCDNTTYTGSIFGYEWLVYDTSNTIVFSSNLECPTITINTQGVYKILVNVDGGPCGIVSDSIYVSVFEPADIVFDSYPGQVCESDTSFQIEVQPQGGNWFGSNAINQNGWFNPQVAGPGIFTIYYDKGVGPCYSLDSVTIQVVEQPTINLSNIGSYCLDGSPINIAVCDFLTSTGPINSYSWVVIDSSRNQVNSSSSNCPNFQFTSAGQFTIFVEANGGVCGNLVDSSNLFIQVPATIEFLNTQNTFCTFDSSFLFEANPPGGVWSGSNAINQNGLFQPSLANSGAHTLQYEVGSGLCNSTATFSLVVYEAPTLNLSPVMPICLDAGPVTIDFCDYVSYTGNISGFIWELIDSTGTSISSSSSPCFNYSFDTDGRFQVMLTIEDANCGPISDSVEITVFSPQVISVISSPDSLCIADSPFQLEVQPSGGVWSGSSAINQNGLFDPAIAGPGSHQIVYEVGNGQCNADVSLIINVVESSMLNSDSIGTFCLDQGPVALNFCDYFSYSGFIQSHHWSIYDVGGNIISSSANPCYNYIFSSPGEFIIKLAINGGPCGLLVDSSTVIIQDQSEIDFNLPNDPVCDSDSSFIINVTPLGGSWSGSGAVTNGGLFDPSLAGVGTTYLLYEVGSGSCYLKDSLDITILRSPSVALDSIQRVCDSLIFAPNVQYDGEINSYAWTFSDGNPSTSSLQEPNNIRFNIPGINTVRIEVDGVCGMATDSIEFEIISIPPINFDAINLPLCNNSSPVELEVIPTGGQWSGVGIVQDSLFDPSIPSVQDSIFLVYTVEEDVCEKKDSIGVFILESQEVMVDSAILVCENSPPIQINFSPSGGLWQGAGIVNDTSGIVDPSILSPGNHVVTYGFEDSQGCTIEKNTVIEIEELPSITVDSFASYCVIPDDIFLSNQIVIDLSPPNGTLNWSGNGVIDSTGVFNAFQNGANGPGDYIIYYTYTLQECFIQDSTLIEITEKPMLEIGGDTILCITDNYFQIPFNLPNGIWSGSGVDTSSGEVNLDVAGGGLFLYEYILNGGTSCEVRDSIEIEILDFSNIEAGQDIIVCENSPPITLTNFSPTGGNWSGPGITDSLVGVFDPSLLAPDSTYTLNYCISSDQVSCTACDQITVRVNPKPAALFEIVGTTCIGEEIEINNMSNLGCDFSWSFGNGLTSTEENPMPVYDTIGDYTIQLIVNSCESCKDTISLDIFVTEPPHAEFAKDLNEGCAVLDVSFDNASFGTDVQYLWDFGNGVTDTISEPGVISFDQGTQDTTYYINLSAINGCGTVQFRDSVTVFPLPLTDFGTNVDDGCSPLEIEFANATLGNPDSFYWYLDGVFISSDTIIPNQIFTTGDSTVSTYNVTLIATNECGIDTFERIITVYPPNVEAFFHVDTTKGCQPLTVQLTNYSTPGASISWDFGDGNGSNATNPVHTFDSAGIFTIYQYAANCGTDTDSILIEVLPQPDVSFEVAPYACLNQETIFENTSQNTFGSSWDFGDGDSSIVFNPVHVFDSLGTYTVTLTGYSQLNNCPASFSQDVEIIGPPDIGFSPSRLDGCAPLEVDFQNTSQGARFFSWIFDDGNSSNAVNPRHVFEEPGRYAVTLIGTDSFGCFTDSTIVNIIAHDLPVSSFELNQNTFCSRVDTLQTINNSVDAVQNLWTFNEDVNFTTNQPKLVWPDTGWIDIVLEVENQFGCRDTSLQNVYIKASPLADIVTDENEGCKPLRVQFTNNSRFSNLNYWDFGDGNTRNILSPTHTYLSDGSFVATFIASHSNNCPSDTVQVPIEVYPLPVSSFSPGDTVICGLPVDLLFQNNSSGAVNYDWNIGASSSNNFEPIVTFDQEGSVDVRLIVSTQFDCKDTSYHTVHLNEQPVALFSPEDLETCELENIQFNSLSLDADYWLWDFGDGGQSQEENPIYQYPEQGTYTVSLMVGNNDVCFDTLTAINGIVVRNGPIADFDWTDEGKGFIQFANLSQEADFYNWDFNDGTPISNSINPLHEFWDNGNWEVTLTAISINGCENAITKTVSPDFFFGLYVPNAFSPETGIGEVRLFKPKGKGIVDYHMQVYSPWGEQVWSSTIIDGEEPGEAWDGTYKGAILPQGAYVWKVTVEFVNGKREVRTGTVILLR